MNSKLEVRIEAVKLAINTEGVTSKNIVETSEAIARFIIGDAELPETYDSSSAVKELIDKFPKPTIPPAYESKEK